VSAAAVAGVTLGVAALAGGGERVSLSRDVQAVFDAKCVACHPVSYPQLDLRRGRARDQLVRVPAQTNLAFQRVLPGRPELSYLLTHPPDPLLVDLVTPAERELIARWIADGAPDN
jgi:mono/diheme cytochrome c family protein